MGLSKVQSQFWAVCLHTKEDNQVFKIGSYLYSWYLDIFKLSLNVLPKSAAAEDCIAIPQSWTHRALNIAMFS